MLLSILAGLFAPSFKRMDCNQQIASKGVVAYYDTVLFRTGFLDLLFLFILNTSHPTLKNSQLPFLVGCFVVLSLFRKAVSHQASEVAILLF